MYGDGGCLYLQITGDGEVKVAKSWILRYRFNGHTSKAGRPLAREMGLGSLAHARSPKRASGLGSGGGRSTSGASARHIVTVVTPPVLAAKRATGGAALCEGRVDVRYSSQSYLAAFNSPALAWLLARKTPSSFLPGVL